MLTSVYVNSSLFKANFVNDFYSVFYYKILVKTKKILMVYYIRIVITRINTSKYVIFILRHSKQKIVVFYNILYFAKSCGTKMLFLSSLVITFIKVEGH